MVACNRINRKLDAMDEREQPEYQHYNHHQPPPAAYEQPPYASFNSGVNNTGWPPPPSAHVPLQYPAPAYVTPWQTTVDPYFDNQPQPYFHNNDPYRQPTSQTYTDSRQQKQLVYRPPPPSPQHYFHTQPPPSHDYHQPPKLSSQQPLLTAALPHQNYSCVPPPKTYQPPPPPPLILDCDQVEEGFADSNKKIPDSSAGFGGVEKVEKMEKSSRDSARKEKPVQGCVEI
ncbi:extensin-3-like [Salvia splendens]|uniref:extensin-3-like n=1 Tax=Salvia splendens TaxID=180675 RepID=UPI001C27B001|nr:extensin-3-like [Salvia splendens]